MLSIIKLNYFLPKGSHFLLSVPFFLSRYFFLVDLVAAPSVFGFLVHMRSMEGNYRSDTPPIAVDCCCADVLLDRPSSESVESCGDVLHCEEEDDSKIWTDEKHSLYLEHLEVSFVKQLHQSMGFLAQCSDKNKRGKYTSQMNPINSHSTSEQCGCWENINHRRSNVLSGVSANSHNPFKGLRMDGPPISADMPELIFHTEDHGKEGTGQNFMDDNSQNNSDTNARAKRLKTASADSSRHYWILPSDSSPKTDY